MRIGLDLDGVICDFYGAYEKLLISIAAVDRFKPRPTPWGVADQAQMYPPVWNWPEHYGYSEDEVGTAWTCIKASPDFWLELPALPEGKDLIESGTLDRLLGEHDVYFITARPGHRAKQQTEEWFGIHAGIDCPTVLLCESKYLACQALNLDLYIDDKGENIELVNRHTFGTLGVLLNRPYNARSSVLYRADTLMEALRNGGAI